MSFEFFEDIYNSILANPVLSAGIGLASAGVITFWVKDVPRLLYSLFRKEFTTELVITSYNIIYHEFLAWIQKNYKDKNFRKLKLSNGRWGCDDKTTTSIGYGMHYIKYKRKHMLLNLSKDSSNQSERDKETISITILGRSRKIFDQIVAEIEKKQKDLSLTELFKMEEGWMHVKTQKKRSLDSIFIEKEKKDQLISNLSKFIANEEWYLSHGIPYQFGVLLYGPPGTGKTSLIKAIAGYLNYPIYYLPPHKLSMIGTAMSTLSDKCIIVVEDIDSSFLTHSREVKDNASEEDKLLTGFRSTSLSEVLNSIDGMFAAHGRILIATTNHIESLDHALIRPGRIDLKIEVGYVNNEILKYFLQAFFPYNKVEVDNIKLKPELTVAILQGLVMQGYDYNKIIEYVKDDK